MKRAEVVSIAVVCLCLGVTAYAEQEGKDKGKPQQEQHQQPQHQQPQPQQHRQQTSTPAQHQQQQPAQQQHQAQRPAQHQQGQPAQQQHQAQKAVQHQGTPQQSYGGVYHGGVQPAGLTHGGVHHSGVPQQQAQVRSGFGQSRASSWSSDHRTWGQRGGYGGYRVPEDRFGLYFGSDHSFRLYGLPMLFVGGYPRFQYDGYWVTFVDQWPETWPETWYETDDVYLDYSNDGYYMYDRMRPGPGIAVTIAF